MARMSSSKMVLKCIGPKCVTSRLYRDIEIHMNVCVVYIHFMTWRVRVFVFSWKFLLQKKAKHITD